MHPTHHWVPCGRKSWAKLPLLELLDGLAIENRINSSGNEDGTNCSILQHLNLEDNSAMKAPSLFLEMVE